MAEAFSTQARDPSSISQNPCGKAELRAQHRGGCTELRASNQGELWAPGSERDSAVARDGRKPDADSGFHTHVHTRKQAPIQMCTHSYTQNIRWRAIEEDMLTSGLHTHAPLK